MCYVELLGVFSRSVVVLVVVGLGLLMSRVKDERQIWGPVFRQGSLDPVNRGKPERLPDRGRPGLMDSCSLCFPHQ